MCDPSSQYVYYHAPNSWKTVSKRTYKVAYNFYLYKYICRNCAHRRPPHTRTPSHRYPGVAVYLLLDKYLHIDIINGRKIIIKDYYCCVAGIFVVVVVCVWSHCVGVNSSYLNFFFGFDLCGDDLPAGCPLEEKALSEFG